MRKLVYLFSLASADLVCDFGEETCERFCNAELCEYHWEVDHRHSMSWRTYDAKNKKIYDYPVEWNQEKETFEITDVGMKSPDNPPVDENGNPKNPMDELENIITLDGRPARRFITINHQFPGPLIRVEQGSVVKVVIKNELPFEAITMHWHGIHQTDNYWMDGAAYISQCPIPAHSNFTYYWRAEEAGIYWYHSHNAIQRFDGLFGGIFIYEKNTESRDIETGEIPLILSDWFHVDSIELSATNPYNYAGTGTMLGMTYYHCRENDRAFDHGVKVTSLCTDSFLVNGYGHYRDQFKPTDSAGGLKQIFKISKNQNKIILPVVHAGFEFPVQIYRMDGGDFTVVSTDSSRIAPVVVSDLIAGIGETYILELDFPENVQSISLRAQLMAQCKGMDCTPLHIPFVDIEIVRDNVPEIKTLLLFETPGSLIKPANRCDGSCMIFNCPWIDFSSDIAGKKCFFIDQAISLKAQSEDLMAQEPDVILNITMNFAHGASINNVKFKYPTNPLYHDEQDWGWYTCPDKIPDQGATCTQVMNVKLGDLVEMRILGAENPESNPRYLWAYHTFHFHGNDVYLTNLGFPKLNEEGLIVDMSPDVICLNDACTEHLWNEANLREKRKQGPLLGKNTLFIPGQGYSIVRFRAKNPGPWPLHCHNLMHNLEGMAMILNIIDERDNRPYSMIPDGLPTCLNQKPDETLYPWQVNIANSAIEQVLPSFGLLLIILSIH